MNSGYVLWFGALVVVAGAALLWLAIGSVPEIPAEPEADADPGLAGKSGATLAPGPASEPNSHITSEPLSEPGPASEPAGEDGIARPG